MDLTNTLDPKKPIKVKLPFTGEIRVMVPRGVGAYPYACTHADKYPNSIVYHGGGAWLASDDLVKPAEGTDYYTLK